MEENSGIQDLSNQNKSPLELRRWPYINWLNNVWSYFLSIRNENVWISWEEKNTAMDYETCLAVSWSFWRNLSHSELKSLSLSLLFKLPQLRLWGNWALMLGSFSLNETKKRSQSNINMMENSQKYVPCQTKTNHHNNSVTISHALTPSM